MSPGIECIGSLLTGYILFASIILIRCAAWALLPKVRAGCGKSARPDPRRGSWATVIPTPTLPSLWSSNNHSLLGSRSRHCYAITVDFTRNFHELTTHAASCNLNELCGFRIRQAQIGFQGLYLPTQS